MKLIDKMTGSVATLYVIGGLFILCGIIILIGKGGFLIAGYNSLPEKEKEKYNKKKLYLDFGICTIIIGVLITLLGVFCNVLPWWSIYIFLGLLVLIILFLFVSSALSKRK